MIELRSDPYVLKPRTAPETEGDFRLHLNTSWCRGVLFNVVALKNSQAMVEYDAILWSDDSIMFLEYKDSVAAYKGLSSRRVQQMSGFARNIARGLGFNNYSFLVVVKSLEERAMKGGELVIPLYELGNHKPEFTSTITELDYLTKLISKFEREGQEHVVKELMKLEKIIQDGIS